MRLEPVLELLWPSRCGGCNAFVPSGYAFCASCEVTLIKLSLSKVGTAWPTTVVGRPAKIPAEALGAFAPFVYGGAITQALLRFKHGNKRCLARPLGRFLKEPLKVFVNEKNQIASPIPLLACPVPLHPHRLRHRGFNQSLELLRQASGYLQRHERPLIVCDLLQRIRDTPPLGHASRAERQQSLKGAFSIKHGRLVVNRHVLVVDDVMTTGATGLECAQLLWAAGAFKVTILTLARTMPSFLP